MPSSSPSKAMSWTILLIAAWLPISTTPALAQYDAYARIGLQFKIQAEPKQKAINSARKPLDSGAAYVCTLSGFGNLAHCYAR